MKLPCSQLEEIFFNAARFAIASPLWWNFSIQIGVRTATTAESARSSASLLAVPVVIQLPRSDDRENDCSACCTPKGRFSFRRNLHGFRHPTIEGKGIFSPRREGAGGVPWSKSKSNRETHAALAKEEEHVLRCVDAVVIMH